MAQFIEYPQDDFSPEYGGVKWKYRLNSMLETAGVELIPVGYEEDALMQVTQENTVIYINQIADELDCIAVKYDKDPDDIFTFYYREKFDNDEAFQNTVDIVGRWAMNIITLYPMKHIVEQYESFHKVTDHVPEEWK